MIDETGCAIPLTSEEWGEAWKQRQVLRHAPHDADYWNERSRTYAHKDQPSSYAEAFLRLLDAKPGETVFDMGCGTGNLSLPLGREGHQVLAADFSSGMLSQLDEALRAEGLCSVHPLQLSWEEDWAAKGVFPNSYDLCIASRSIITEDLRDSLLKLTAVARRRVCITVAPGVSPRIDMRLMRLLGVDIPPSFDDVYAIAILSAEGYLPELASITTEREDIFESFDDALQNYERMLGMALEAIRKSGLPVPSEDQALERLREWLEEQLVPAQDAGMGGALKLRQPRTTTWAFISWNTGGTA